MAVAARIRHPHDQWARVANEVSKVRHKFGHMLHLDEIEGEIPHRTLHFTRLGSAGERYRGRGDSLGLSWRDDEWAQQARHRDSVTEQELWQTLEKEYWLIQVSRAGSAISAGYSKKTRTARRPPHHGAELVHPLVAARMGRTPRPDAARSTPAPIMNHHERRLTLLTRSRPAGGFVGAAP